MKQETTGLLASLAARQDAMSENERRIAAAILKEPAAVTRMSSQALAEKCRVSQSGIIKFCKKIGQPGFPALKIALSAEIARNERVQQIHGDIFSDDSLGEVARKVFDSKVLALSETMKRNDNRLIERAVDLLEGSGRVIVFGIGGSALVAEDFSSKLSKLGVAVLWSGDAHVQLANLASLGPDDLLFAISFSGSTKETTTALEYALEQGIPSIFLCGSTARLKMASPEIVLRCVANEDPVRSSAIATRTAQLAVTDLLFVLLVQRRADVQGWIARGQALVNLLR